MKFETWTLKPPTQSRRALHTHIKRVALCIILNALIWVYFNYCAICLNQFILLRNDFIVSLHNQPHYHNNHDKATVNKYLVSLFMYSTWKKEPIDLSFTCIVMLTI